MKTYINYKKDFYPIILFAFTFLMFASYSNPAYSDRTPSVAGFSPEKVELEVKGFSEPSMYGFTVFLVPIINVDDLVLPISVGEFEAVSMSRFLSEEGATPRPLTYDLFKSFIDISGHELVEIVITDISDGTFYANLVFEHNGNVINLDARPSDAINIALRSEVPIYTYIPVLREAGIQVQLED